MVVKGAPLVSSVVQFQTPDVSLTIICIPFLQVHNVSNEGLHRLLGLLDAQSLSASMMSLNNAMTQSSSPATLLPSNGVLNLDLKVNTGTHDFCVEDSAMNEDQNDPVAEMIEKHALKLAEEGEKI